MTTPQRIHIYQGGERHLKIRCAHLHFLLGRSLCRLIDQTPPVARWETLCEFDESSLQMHRFTGGLYQPIASLSLHHAVVFVNTRCAYVCAF